MITAGGSPPRAWGRPHQPRPLAARPRFTPTCVGTTWWACSAGLSPAVHPHVRGDDQDIYRALPGCAGSPPRAWGRRAGGLGPARPVRFTPTCVGTTLRRPGTRRWRTVHPHVRGDDIQQNEARRYLGGSPPRAWGRQRRRRHRLALRRFTPTCVGTTSPRSSPSGSRPVHPHVRGDDDQLLREAGMQFGSPPRAGGRPRGGAGDAHQQRFTPTCVGTTGAGRRCKPSSPVHPHVRGDDGLSPWLAAVVAGSPPRAWGRRVRVKHAGQRGRFTPTCVGTTTRAGECSPALTVHPHVRGDDMRTISTISPPVGSPPRAWGRLVPRRGRDRRHRFTPTCVGTTPASGLRTALNAVHPHVRGDDALRAARAADAAGSPPRAWGRRPRRPVGPRRRRFTPTCVGTTECPQATQEKVSVHPHVRGDDADSSMRRRSEIGSPPRAWGRLSTIQEVLERDRFTPTCVGTTDMSKYTVCRISVHPHVRGDDRLDEAV